MLNTPKISVIIPVYNTEKYLSACLDSMAAQTFKDFETIIIDNNSPDNSAAIIEKYVKQYPHFSTYKRIGGLAGGARNEGLKYAKGEYLFFLDSDDSLTANALETLYNCALTYKADIVNCLHNQIDESGKDLKGYKISQEPSFLLSAKDQGTLEILKYLGNRAGPVGKLFKRTIFTENNLTFPEDVPSEDVALITTCALFSVNFYQLNVPLYNRRHVPLSLSNTTRDLALKSLFNNFALLRQPLQKYPFFKGDIREEWEFRLVSMIIGGEGPGNGGLKNLSAKRVKEIFSLSKDFYLNLSKDFFKNRNIVFRAKYSLFLFALKHNYYYMHKLTRGPIDLFYTLYKLFNRGSHVYE